MQRPPADAREFVHTSAVLQQLHDEAPMERFTLGWLMGSLRKRYVREARLSPPRRCGTHRQFTAAPLWHRHVHDRCTLTVTD